MPMPHGLEIQIVNSALAALLHQDVGLQCMWAARVGIWQACFMQKINAIS